MDERLRGRQLDTEQSKVCIGIFSTVQQGDKLAELH